MLYNQGMPVGYNPAMIQPNYQFAYNGIPQGQQQIQQQQMQQIQQPPQPVQQNQNAQIQNGGFVSVRSIDEARQWAVAPGNSVTFKIEGLPYVCEKTMGFSQLESPKFEIFKLVKENSSESPENATQGKSENVEKPQSFVMHDEFDSLVRNFSNLETEIRKIKEKMNDKSNYSSTSKKKEPKQEVNEDE